MLNKSTLTNLKRRAEFVDKVQLVDGKPFPSWIDINPTEVCNRSAGSKNACVFCPRIDSTLYPNQNLHISIELAEKIGYELRSINYQGAVVLCGYGEPLLHPKFFELVRAFSFLRTEVVTNGDKLTTNLIRSLNVPEQGLSCFFAVSMYDGPHQVDHLQAMFYEAGVDNYILRDRWHNEDQDFGLKLTNRAGTATAGNQPVVDTTRPCYYLAYSMMIDWNGDVLLCSQDWKKKVRFGNLQYQTIREVWNSSAMHKRRTQLLSGNRSVDPCNVCNADGTLLGSNHVEQWRVK